MNRTSTRATLLLVPLALALSASGLEAQGWRDKLKQKVKDRVEQRSEEAMDRAIDTAEGAVVCAVADQRCIDDAAKAGKDVAITDEDGNVVERRSASSAARPGEGAWANYDFVPGERVLFAEDFSRDRVGNFPRRMELLGGTMEVVDWEGKRWLRVAGEGALKIPLPEALPQRFTVEFDMPLPWMNVRMFSGEDRYQTTYAQIGGTESGLAWPGDRRSMVDPHRLFPGLDQEFENSFLARTVRVRMHVDGKYVKVYIDEQRVANVPNADFGREDFLVLEFQDNTNAGSYPYSHLITNLSVNAGGREMYDALMADGRIATQGIYFDTGSDRIRPESSGTLAEIAAMLEAHAELRLTIEGHTDNVGAAAANKTLSQKRAAAVKAALVSTYGIDADRLQTTGFGAEKPTADNGTPEGRQQNRRVELVRM